MSFEQTEDLKAFERRLTEVIDKLQPAARFWRIILIFVSVCTAAGAWTWLWDPETTHVSFVQSLWNHPFFTISCITLFTLFLFGIHKRVVAPSIFSLLPFILKLSLPQLFYFISSFSSHSPKFDHLFFPTPFSDWKTNSFKTQAIYMTVGILVIHLPLFDQDFCLFKQLKN